MTAPVVPAPVVPVSAAPVPHSSAQPSGQNILASGHSHCPVFTIRPEPGLSATMAAGRQLGLNMAGVPLFHIHPLAWDVPAASDYDALLLGSANVLRHAGSGLATFADKPVYAVGEATAAAARQAGFEVAATGDTNLQHMLNGMAGRSIRFLRLAGAVHVAVTPPSGILVDICAVYESLPLPMPADFADQLRSGGVVLLHSAGAARHFATECDRLRIERHRLRLAALAPRVAQAAGTGWAKVAVAEKPRDMVLLALAHDLCH